MADEDCSETSRNGRIVVIGTSSFVATISLINQADTATAYLLCNKCLAWYLERIWKMEDGRLEKVDVQVKAFTRAISDENLC